MIGWLVVGGSLTSQNPPHRKVQPFMLSNLSAWLDAVADYLAGPGLLWAGWAAVAWFLVMILLGEIGP